MGKLLFKSNVWRVTLGVGRLSGGKLHATMVGLGYEGFAVELCGRDV